MGLFTTFLSRHVPDRDVFISIRMLMRECVLYKQVKLDSYSFFVSLLDLQSNGIHQSVSMQLFLCEQLMLIDSHRWISNDNFPANTNIKNVLGQNK